MLLAWLESVFGIVERSFKNANTSVHLPGPKARHKLNTGIWDKVASMMT
jgi:hypothetical protein